MATRLALLLIITSTCSTAYATDVTSRVDAVTVYPAGATVTRIADVDLVAGSNLIRMTGLVSSLNVDQLQVEVAESAVRIGQIKLYREQQRDAFNSEIVELEAKIYAQDRRIQALNDSSNAARLRLKFLDGIAQGYASEAGMEASRGAADVESWRAALEILQSGYEDAHKLIRDNDGQRADMVKDASVLKRQLADLRGRSLATTAIELALTVDRPVQTAVRLHYFQVNAGWSPHYESRLNSNSGELQLAQQAEVNQETDEDWDGVTLTLSTSDPGGELVAPTVSTEFLSLYEDVPIEPADRSLQAAAPSAYMEGDLEEIMVTGARRANVGNFAVNYDIPGRTSVPNDAQEPLTIDLAGYTFNAELVTQVVPRRSTQAFLAARFVYDKTLPLYGSDMAVFVDGVFAGNTEMPTALPQSEVVLPMGQDRRVEVRSQTQGDAAGTGGIVNRRKSESTDYVFEITNRRSIPSYVEVADRYPVARNRDIDVDVPRSATSPDEKDIADQPGIVLWKKTLQPGETWRIRHQYTISYPASRILVRQ